MIAVSIEELEILTKKLLKTGTDYFVFDSETRAKSGRPDDDALVYGRADPLLVSFCVSGHAYSVPTSLMGPSYPSFADICDKVIKPLFDAGRIIVCHNLNYDGANVLFAEGGIVIPETQFYCTLIGAWASAEYNEKGLKSRSFALGRILSETKHVHFQDLVSLAIYAENDVIATDELYQLQRFGKVSRPREVITPGVFLNDVIQDAVMYRVPNPQPVDYVFPENEKLRPYMKKWCDLVELPVLASTMRAEQRGFPVIRERFLSIRSKLTADVEARLKEVYQFAGEEVNIGSGPQMLKIFKKLGINNPYTSRKSGKMSFNAKALNKLRGTHPFIDAVVSLRQLLKLQSVYVGSSENIDADDDLTEAQSSGDSLGFEHFINPETGCIHCTLATVGAVTGRNTSSNPNMQQVPSRKDTYGLKDCFGFAPAVI